MGYTEISAAVITLLGAGLVVFERRSAVEYGVAPAKQGPGYLLWYTVIVILFGALSVGYYWRAILLRAEDILFAVWLFLTMIGGMFAQVLAANYRARGNLFDISRDRLLYPLLFSVIVFYPIWALGSEERHTFFAFHAAFLNGYFWENVVSAAKPLSRKRAGSH